MKKRFNLWDDNLAKRLQDLQPEPAFDAWERIEASLEEKPKRSWIWVAASTALISSSLGLLLYLSQAEESKPLELAQNQVGAQHIKAEKNKSLQVVADAPGNDKAALAEITQAEEGQKAAAALPLGEGLAGESAKRLIAGTKKGLRKHESLLAAASGSSFTATSGQTKSLLGEENKYPAVSTHNQELYTVASIAPKNKTFGFMVKVPFVPRQPMVTTASLAVVNKKKKPAATSFWAEAMPTWSYRRIEPSQTDGVIISAMEAQPTLASARMGGQLATGISMPLGKKLQWKTGAYYWYQQQRWSYSYHNALPDSYKATSTESGKISLNPVYEENTHHIDLDLHNLGLSTGFSYQLPAGFVSSALETKVQAHYNAYEKFSSLLSLAYSVQAVIDKKLKIHVGPSVQMQLNNNQNLSPHFQEKGLSLGLQMGVSFDH